MTVLLKQVKRKLKFHMKAYFNKLINVDRFSDNLKQIDKHLLDYFQG